MTDKSKQQDEIPWDKMDKKAVNTVAFIKGLGGVLLGLATGVLALVLSVGSMKQANQNNTLIVNLTESNTLLTNKLNEALFDLQAAQTELTIIRKEMEIKDGKIYELEQREKELLIRIEDLEKQLNSQP